MKQTSAGGVSVYAALRLLTNRTFHDDAKATDINPTLLCQVSRLHRDAPRAARRKLESIYGVPYQILTSRVDRNALTLPSPAQ